jgi:hypothetical protein
MPHAFGSSGAHTGIGRALVLVTPAEILVVEAEEVWVEAAAPVRARTTIKARTIFFMMDTPKVVFTVKRFLFTDLMF